MLSSPAQKPEWIPDSAWTDIAEWHALQSDPSVHKVVAKVIACQDCECVWRAIEKRINRTVPEPGLRDEALLPAVPLTPAWLDYLLRHTPQPMPGVSPYIIVLATVALYAEWTDEAVMLPAAERRRIAGSIANHARALHDALSSAGGLGKATVPLFHDIGENIKKRELFRADATILPLFECLDAIAEGAAKWGASLPLVGQPRATGAKRLYFVRRMTKAFRAVFGSPLREQVAALTRCVFECEMDAATVRKLAP